jgi:hypothetical protein
MRLLLSKMRYDAVHGTVLPSYAASIPTAPVQQQQQQQPQQQQQQHNAVAQQERDAHFEASLKALDRMGAITDSIRRTDCTTAAGAAHNLAALQKLDQMTGPLLAQCAGALGLSKEHQQAHLTGNANSSAAATAAGAATYTAATAMNAASASTATAGTSKKRQLPQLPLPYSNQSANRGSKSAKYGHTASNTTSSSGMSQSSNAGKAIS